MARPIVTRKVQNFLRQKLLPGQVTEAPITFFRSPKGEDHIKALTDLSPDESPFVENFTMSPDSAYITRGGVETVGGVAVSAICGLTVFSSRTSSDYIVRVTTVGVELWSGSSWSTLSGPVLAITSATNVKFTVWDDKLLFTDASTGLYEISISSGTYVLINFSPTARHLTTFGGRVIASYVIEDADPTVLGTFPTRIEWSVKNDSTDWLGLGSGYEDLLSAPGGTVDIQHGVIPVTDVEAFVIRSSSIWVMNTTGYFDTPFQFTYRFDQGTDSPESIVRVPSAKGEASGALFSQIMMLSTDDVVVVRPEGITPVGFPIRDQLLNNTLNARRAIAGYEPRNREYWIHVPPLSNTNTTSVVWKYRIDEKVWYHGLYPFKLTKIAFKDLLFEQTFDELTGTMDELPGVMDDLGLSTRKPSALFACVNEDRVLRERADVIGDVNSLGSATGISIEIQTGMITPSSPLENLTLIMLNILYEATQSITAIFEYSVDAGASWLPYGQVTLGATAGPTVLPYRYTIHVPKVQLRMRSDDGSTLQLHSLFVKLVKGSDIYQ